MFDLEILEASAAQALQAGVPKRFVVGCLTLTPYELEEDKNCPVPGCLNALLIAAACGGRTGADAIRELPRILDKRGEHFGLNL